jgi:hypothetical protein
MDDFLDREHITNLAVPIKQIGVVWFLGAIPNSFQRDAWAATCQLMQRSDFQPGAMLGDRKSNLHIDDDQRRCLAKAQAIR